MLTARTATSATIKPNSVVVIPIISLHFLLVFSLRPPKRSETGFTSRIRSDGSGCSPAPRRISPPTAAEHSRTVDKRSTLCIPFCTMQVQRQTGIYANMRQTAASQVLRCNFCRRECKKCRAGRACVVNHFFGFTCPVTSGATALLVRNPVQPDHGHRYPPPMRSSPIRRHRLQCLRTRKHAAPPSWQAVQFCSAGSTVLGGRRRGQWASH